MKFISPFCQKHIYIIGIIYALIALAIFPKWTVDDAFITYRYAHNLAEHGELTWNVGENPIEGYTGIALPLAIAFFIKLGVSPVLSGKIIGVIFYFLSVWWLHRILFKLNLSWLLRSLILILYLTSPFMFSHSWCGLETVPYTALLLAVVNQLLSVTLAKEADKSKERLLFLLMLVVCLVRPEAVVLAFTTIISLLIIGIKFERRNPLDLMKSALIFFILPGIAYFLWRWNYYGFFLPNTFYAKGGPQLLVKGSIIAFAVFVIYFYILPSLLVMISTWGNFAGAKARLRSHFESEMRWKVIYIGIAVALFCTIINLKYFQSLLLMNFESRFFAPYYPIFLAFIAVFIEAGFSALSDIQKPKPWRFRLIFVALVLVYAGQLLINQQRLGKYIYLRWGYQKLTDECLLSIGEYLKYNVPPQEWLAVIYDTGAIPYTSELRTLDFSRLNNEFLAHHQLSAKETVDYFFGYHPGAIVISSDDWEKPHNIWYYGDEVGMITADPRFSQYSLVRKYRTSVPPDNPSADYFEFLFVRKDLLPSP
jgi:hypothetical protein